MEKIGFKMSVKDSVSYIDDERGVATEEVDVREAEREKSELGEVDRVKEKAGSKGKVKNVEKSDQ